MIRSSENGTVLSNLMNERWSEVDILYLTACTDTVSSSHLSISLKGEWEVMEVVIKARHGRPYCLMRTINVQPNSLSPFTSLVQFLCTYYDTGACRTKTPTITSETFPTTRYQTPRISSPWIPAFRCSCLSKKRTFTVSLDVTHLTTCRAFPLHVRMTV